MHAAPIENLIEQFAKLPGIGRKSAERLAFHILDMPKEYGEAIGEAIENAKEKICFCSVCQNLTESDPCPICSDERRDKKIICVVETPKDAAAMEKIREFSGVYHVLHGALSPIDGIGPEDLKIAPLLSRIQKDGADEIIMATNPNVQGEATAMYLFKLLKPLGIKITRIANGIPIGGDLEYADEVTLLKAIEGRREM